MIRPNRYYVHVYQAKVEFKKYDLRTLASRKMVAYLKDKWGKWYWPRRTDLLDKSQKNRRDKPKSLQPGNQWVDRSKQSERWSRHANRGQKKNNPWNESRKNFRDTEKTLRRNQKWEPEIPSKSRVRTNIRNRASTTLKRRTWDKVIENNPTSHRRQNNNNFRYAMLREVTGEFLGMLEKITTSIGKIKSKFDSL